MRRGLVVPLVFVVGSPVADPETGALATVASLFLGLQQRDAAASCSWRVMLVVLLTLVAAFLVSVRVESDLMVRRRVAAALPAVGPAFAVGAVASVPGRSSAR